MLFKTLTLLLTIGAALAVTPIEVRLQTERSLMDVMMMDRAADPTVQQYCFNRYIPILKQASDTYESEYNGCQTTFDEKCATIDSGYTKLRENVTATAKNSCQTLQKCDSISQYADAFDCFGKTAYEESNNLSYMSGQSVKAAASIKEEYKTAEFTFDNCRIESFNKYMDVQTSANTDLQDCLNGIIKPYPDTTIYPETPKTTKYPETPKTTTTLHPTYPTTIVN